MNPMTMNKKEAAKAERERRVFAEFCGIAGLSLDPDTVASQTVPNPDIRCTISAMVQYAEMVEVTDERVARSVNTSAAGTSFSQEEPLRKAFESKALNRYATQGAPLHLVAYYDTQYPLASDKTLIPDTV